jgi:uncharacterized membrane protein YkoI
MFVKQLLARRRIVLLSILLASYASAGGNAFDRYALPRDKRTMDACRQLALAAHPGTVQKINPHNTSDGFQYHFEIEDRDGVMWVVVCDARSERVVIDQTIP